MRKVSHIPGEAQGLHLNKRPDWNTYFMEIATLVSRRSTCLRRQVGAVIVKERNILSSGYNGAPSGITHCETAGCLREKMNVPSGERHELCRGLHAEQNAIIQAACHGATIKGAAFYCTNLPCSICTKMIINSGADKIIYKDGYFDPLASEMIEESGILIQRIK